MRINELLRYFQRSEPYYETENFHRIVERVRYFKTQKESVTMMCEIADKIRQEGKAEGKREDKAEGRREGMVEAILELLEDLGKIPNCLKKRICQETNPKLLSKWHKHAARASSLAEFEANMLK